jgi:hypothetical protein
MAVAAGQGVEKIPGTQTESFGQAPPTMQPAETRMIFIVGGNIRLMEWAALSLFRAGHIPVLGQWFWPLVTSETAAEAALDESGDPVAERLLGRCDAILRIDGPAPDADALVTCARLRGMRVYNDLEDALAG